MNQSDFVEFVDLLTQRWPFYKVNEERQKKLWAMFRDFPLSTLRTAVHKYDLANPDANFQSFKLKELLTFCFDEQQTAGDTMQWSPCDEGMLVHHIWAANAMGEPPDELNFVTEQLGKPQMPSDWQRKEATHKLRELGAKPISVVMRTQEETNVAYNKFLRAAASQVPASAKREPNTETYSERARRLNAATK